MVSKSEGRVRGSAAYTLLAEADFRRVWLVGGLSGVVRWLEMLAFGVYVFDLTGSPLIVALMTLLRMLPLALFGAVTGALSERVGHRRMLIGSLAVMALVSAGMAALAAADELSLGYLAIGTLLGGAYWTTDLPARRNMMGAIAGSDRVAIAMSIDAATSNITRAIGPALGGLLLAAIGIAGALSLSTVVYVVSLGLMLAVTAPAGGRMMAQAQNLWRNLYEGLRHAAGDRALVGALAITVIFNVWAWPYTSMIPVIGRDVLGLGPFPVGLLMSAEGIGALTGSLIAATGRGPHHYRRLYVGGLVLCLFGIIVLSRTGSPVLAGAAILVAGLGAGAFSAMQATLIYMMSPPEVRARMLGVLSVCIGTAPLGYAHLGLLANWIGTTDAVLVMSLEGLVVAAIAWWLWPEIR